MSNAKSTPETNELNDQMSPEEKEAYKKGVQAAMDQASIREVRYKLYHDCDVLARKAGNDGDNELDPGDAFTLGNTFCEVLEDMDMLERSLGDLKNEKYQELKQDIKYNTKANIYGRCVDALFRNIEQLSLYARKQQDGAERVFEKMEKADSIKELHSLYNEFIAFHSSISRIKVIAERLSNAEQLPDISSGKSALAKLLADTEKAESTLDATHKIKHEKEKQRLVEEDAAEKENATNNLELEINN